MTDALAPIGHNNPPDPIDQITAAHEAHREEADNWLDGSLVENEGQMKAVDELRGSMRQWRLGLERGQKEATAPLRAVYQAELDRWKPTIEDAKRYEAALVSVQEPFKKLLLAQKEAEKKAAWEAANKARQEAEEAALQATAHDVQSQREAAAKAEEAQAALQAASAAQKDTVKGMRNVKRHEVISMRDLVHWIAKHDKAAMTEFATKYAKMHNENIPDAIVRSWSEKEAF